MSAVTEDWKKIEQLEVRVKALEHLTHGHHECVPTQRPVKAEPELIQGYTAEQWQEIIAGGYLCGFSGFGNSSRGLLEIIKEGDYPFRELDGSDWSNCRPAQIKGVIRPIFVEPVDNPYCVFFDSSRHVTGYGEWQHYHTDAYDASYVEL